MATFLCSYIFVAVVTVVANSDLLADECVVNGPGKNFALATFGDGADLFLSLARQADTVVTITSGEITCQIRVNVASQPRGEWLPARLSLAARPSLTVNGQHFGGGDDCSPLTAYRKDIVIQNAVVLNKCPQEQPTFYIPANTKNSVEIPWFGNQINLGILLEDDAKIQFSVGKNELFLCKSADGRIEATNAAANCGDVKRDTRIHLRVTRIDGSFQIEVDNRGSVSKPREDDDTLKFPHTDAAGPVNIVQCFGECREADAGGAGSSSYNSPFIGVTVVLVLVLLVLGVYCVIKSNMLKRQKGQCKPCKH